MSLETSKRALAKATARDLEDFKKWLGTYSFTGLLTSISSESVTCSLRWYLQLDIDPVTAKTPFFAPENATKWAVLEQWHTFWRGLYPPPVIPSGFRSFLRNPEELNLAEGPAKFTIPVE